MVDQLRCGACQQAVTGTWEDHIATCEEYRLQSAVIRAPFVYRGLREKLKDARKLLKEVKQKLD